jgi:hypothetical protein
MVYTQRGKEEKGGEGAEESGGGSSSLVLEQRHDKTLTLQSPVVTIYSTCFNILNSTFCPQGVFTRFD